MDRSGRTEPEFLSTIGLGRHGLALRHFTAPPFKPPVGDCGRRLSETNPHATILIQTIPRFIPHTNPTPPDESDTTGQVFLQIRMNPTSPNHSDRMHPPHNPSVVGSIPTGPTKWDVGQLLPTFYENQGHLLGADSGRGEENSITPQVGPVGRSPSESRRRA
jgi:hypothetical protein